MQEDSTAVDKALGLSRIETDRPNIWWLRKEKKERESKW
jgi:hypothetical protein